jgi:hypothetical protein
MRTEYPQRWFKRKAAERAAFVLVSGTQFKTA